MVNAQTEINIRVPRTDVAEYAANPENAPQWYPNIDSARSLTKPPLRVGSKTAFSVRFWGRTLDYSYEFIKFVPAEKLVFTDTYTEGWKPASEPFMTAILLLSDGPDGGTTYTAIARHRTPDAPRPSDNSFSAIIRRVVASSSASPTPQQCDRIRLRCRVAVSSGAIFTEASLPKPVFTP